MTVGWSREFRVDGSDGRCSEVSPRLKYTTHSTHSEAASTAMNPHGDIDALHGMMYIGHPHVDPM